jgi:uridylate kinase
MAEAKKRIVFLKLSGERLGREGSGWHADAIKTTSEKMARVRELSKQIGVEGIVLVSGAGNIIRGDMLKKRGVAPRRADMRGRLGTIMNSLVIVSFLKERGVPCKVFIAPSMAYKDALAGQPGFQAETYSVEKIKDCFKKGEVVIIAGGAGKDDATTDYAVAFYAGDYHKHYPKDEVIVLKGTQLDGVFEGDPKKVKGVRCYKMIGAPMMQRDYDRFSAVDKHSLQEIIDNNLEMLVYADGQHELETVLRHDLVLNSMTGTIGTLIVARDIEPILY